MALSRAEYDLLVQQLGREPNEVELGMFGSLWSELRGYKNSKPLLKVFSSGGDHILTKVGAEKRRRHRHRRRVVRGDEGRVAQPPVGD